MDPGEGLIDVHTHLDRYPPQERELVLNRANEAGVRWIVTSGMDLDTAREAVEIAAAHGGVLASVGVHPWVAAEDFPPDFHEGACRLAQKDVTVAIGEVGLDFIDNVFTGVTYYDNKDLQKAQEVALRQQVELACELRLPLIVHCRGAYPRLISILQEERVHRVRGVIHNFDGGKEVAGRLLDLGFYLSFGGTLTYPEATSLREIARYIPPDGILIETDSPYMPLYLQAAERNEPANVAQVAQVLAGIKHIDIGELTTMIYTNFRILLALEGSAQGIERG